MTTAADFPEGTEIIHMIARITEIANEYGNAPGRDCTHAVMVLAAACQAYAQGMTMKEPALDEPMKLAALKGAAIGARLAASGLVLIIDAAEEMQ